MKKIYQMPETDVVILRVSGIIMEDTETSGIGQVIQGNENNTFEEDELSTDMNKSDLWEH